MRLIISSIIVLSGLLTCEAAWGGSPPSPPPGTTVEMPFLIAPLVVDGNVIANAFISSRIAARSAAATLVIRDRLPFIQDAFVRDVNATPIGKPSDPGTVDTAALTTRLENDAIRIVGRAAIASLLIVNVEMAKQKSAPPH